MGSMTSYINRWEEATEEYRSLWLTYLFSDNDDARTLLVITMQEIQAEFLQTPARWEGFAESLPGFIPYWRRQQEVGFANLQALAKDE